jgi:hypothetical protein
MRCRRHGRGCDADRPAHRRLWFFFCSLENNEPPHIHVEHGDNAAQYWLDPVTLAMNSGFRSNELTKLRLLGIEHRATFQEAWDGHFGN